MASFALFSSFKPLPQTFIHERAGKICVLEENILTVAESKEALKRARKVKIGKKYGGSDPEYKKGEGFAKIRLDAFRIDVGEVVKIVCGRQYMIALTTKGLVISMSADDYLKERTFFFHKMVSFDNALLNSTFFYWPKKVSKEELVQADVQTYRLDILISMPTRFWRLNLRDNEGWEGTDLGY